MQNSKGFFYRFVHVIVSIKLVFLFFFSTENLLSLSQNADNDEFEIDVVTKMKIPSMVQWE